MEHVEQLMPIWLEPRKAFAAAIANGQQQKLVVERAGDHADAVIDFRSSTGITARDAFEQMKRMNQPGYKAGYITIEKNAP